MVSEDDEAVDEDISGRMGKKKDAENANIHADINNLYDPDASPKTLQSNSSSRSSIRGSVSSIRRIWWPFSFFLLYTPYAFLQFCLFCCMNFAAKRRYKKQKKNPKKCASFFSFLLFFCMNFESENAFLPFFAWILQSNMQKKAYHLLHIGCMFITVKMPPSHRSSSVKKGGKKKKKLKLSKELSDLVVYLQSRHFHDFEEAKEKSDHHHISSINETKCEKLFNKDSQGFIQHTARLKYTFFA